MRPPWHWARSAEKLERRTFRRRSGARSRAKLVWLAAEEEKKQAKHSLALCYGISMTRILFLSAALSLGLCAASSSSPAITKLMIFGGNDHQTYLGCLNCSPASPESIFNRSGAYGHCALFSDNLYCRGPLDHFGTTSLFESRSACVSDAKNPPVIVSPEGKYYGRFSIGDAFGHSDAVCHVIGRFANSDACALVERVCAAPESGIEASE
jgi:hypothetical protein